METIRTINLKFVENDFNFLKEKKGDKSWESFFGEMAGLFKNE